MHGFRIRSRREERCYPIFRTMKREKGGEEGGLTYSHMQGRKSTSCQSFAGGPPGGPGAALGGPLGDLGAALGGQGAPSESTFGKQAALQNHWFIV